MLGCALPFTYSELPLPSLNEVREDVARLHAFRLAIPDRFFSPDGHEIPEPIAWFDRLPRLFKWAWWVREYDDAIFALEMGLRALNECTEAELSKSHIYQSGKDAAQMKPFMTYNLLTKLHRHLCHPHINRPAEAVQYLKALVALHEKNVSNEPWLIDPELYCSYGDALVGSGAFTAETKEVLEHALQATDVVRKQNDDMSIFVLRVRTNLSFVLEQLDVEPELQKEHTEWTTKFLRNNPTYIRDEYLRHLLARPNLPEHPVLRALGGMDRLEKRRFNSRADARIIKMCATCTVRSMQKPLFLCSRCHDTYYCSRECQKSHWKVHKLVCEGNLRAKKEADRLSKIEPKIGQLLNDWKIWLELPKNAVDEAQASALKLQQDPSRGRTHIVFREVEYVSSAKDPRRKFKITRCGVFRVADVLKSNLYHDMAKQGFGAPSNWKDCVLMLTAQGNGGADDSETVPMIDITFGKGLSGCLGCCNVDLDKLRRVPYDSRWREMMNKGSPPQPLLEFIGLRDAEHAI
ncbi:hypothetical protein A0H81_13875 [Grifola frondosa]|uniref:MYND-type domain-containing protein n=1 Tax=Grifola frondosa TaxID=5627 RepID=A0A1C7LPZ8_GRIFR|nr:hypothetical protein A0H81_13875 [Grifola frondosa]